MSTQVQEGSLGVGVLSWCVHPHKKATLRGRPGGTAQKLGV